jgi:membrane protein
VSETPTARGIPRAAWRSAALRAWHGFLRHRGIDSAAALTFFALLASFPVALTIVSAFAIGNGKRDAATVILDIIDEVVQADTVETLKAPITELFTVTNPGIALALGIVLSLWTVSGYATAFGRAVNSAYEVQEGRQIWRFRGTMLLLAVFLLVIMSIIVVLLLTTQRVATAIGESIGIGEPWITLWSVLRWPVALLLVALVTAVLYYFTPNVHHERFRWVSFGAAFAIVVGCLGTAGFALYVSTVAQYDKVYGWLGGAIVLMLWLYVVNLVLVLGAEVDAEVVRLRQLTAGIDASEVIQVPMRDTTRNLMLARQRTADVEAARAILDDHTPPGSGT